jgi:hypothetical protein
MNNIDASCPQCPGGVKLVPLGTSVGSVGPYDRFDDPTLERSYGMKCPKCSREYLVDNKTGKTREL